jgi:hypothetical protein
MMSEEAELCRGSILTFRKPDQLLAEAVFRVLACTIRRYPIHAHRVLRDPGS